MPDYPEPNVNIRKRAVPLNGREVGMGQKVVTVSQAVASRHSCRDFIPDKVPHLNLIQEILTKAARSASDGNTQPWRVYVLSGDARKQLVQEMQNNKSPPMSEYHNYPDQAAFSSVVYDDAELTAKTKERIADFKNTEYGSRRKVCGQMLYDAIGVPKTDLPGKLAQLAKNGNFFGAPIGIIVTVDRMFDRAGWGNVGMFLTTFALLCEEAGLSTCFQGYFGMYQQVVRNVIKQIDGEKEAVWCGVCVGYSNKNHAINKWRTERASVGDFATFLSSKL
jgi:nitroreductase